MSAFSNCLLSINNFIKENEQNMKWSTFSKRRRANNYDLISYTVDNEIVRDDFVKKGLDELVEEIKIKQLEILISSHFIEKNRICLKLVRSSVIKSALVEILEKQNNFGRSNVFDGKTFHVYSSKSNRSLTQLRLARAKHIVEALIKKGGGYVVSEPVEGSEIVCFGRSNPDNDAKYFILVNEASMAVGSDSTEEHLRQLRREEIFDVYNHKDITEATVNQIVDATITFDVMSVKLEKPVFLDSWSELKSARKANCKGAPFVLYNYTRLCAILEKYDTSVLTKLCLKTAQDINYDLLSDDYEWRLVYDFLVEWPMVVADCQDLRQPNLHKIIIFLCSLASVFSVYYRHTRVLTEGLEHMRPVMDARVHLLLAIKQVFLSAFFVLGIDPPKYM